jgi:hypothetical protein
MTNHLIRPPYKSAAAALIFVIILGPLGVFYTTIIGGVVMTVFGLVAIGTVVSMHSPLPMATIWLISLLWSMTAVHSYNKRLFKRLFEKSSSD